MLIGSVLGEGASAVSNGNSPLGFREFIAATREAQFVEYRANAMVRVADEAGFEEMRQYILQRYADLEVVATMLVGTQLFDCVSVHYGKRSGTAPVPTANGSCPDGTIPMRRLTLEELTRFPTVRSFLGKLPGNE